MGEEMRSVVPEKFVRARPSRRELLRWATVSAGAVGVSSLLAACGGPEETGTAGGVAGNFPETPEYNFVFVNHVTTNPFFTPTRYGIEDAQALLGTTHQWTGSETSDVQEMVQAFDSAIAAGADGIAVAIVDLEAFNDPIERALSEGIPVVSYNADAPNSRLSYYGQDLYGSGFQMGQRIVESVESGHVALFIATPGQLNIQPRIDGAIDAIEESGADITHETIATGPEVSEQLNVIASFFQGNPDVSGMFAVDAGSTQGVAQTIDENDVADRVRSGGYDLLPITLELIAEGSLDFTIDQQPYLQGFLPVMGLYVHKLSGGVATPAETNTGLKFVTQENVQVYLDTESRFEGDSEDQTIVGEEA